MKQIGSISLEGNKTIHLKKVKIPYDDILYGIFNVFYLSHRCTTGLTSLQYFEP